MPKRQNHVTARRLPNRIGLLRVNNFGSENCLGTTAKALRTLGRLNGLILDLRSSTGDAMHDGINFAALLVEAGELWSFKGNNRDGQTHCSVTLGANGFEWVGQRASSPERRCTWTRHECLIQDIPMVVLVNCETGGSGQVLAKVLKSTRSAGVWGAPTSGNGVPTGYFTFQPNGSSLALVSDGFRNLKGEWHALTGRAPVVTRPDYFMQVAPADDKELVIRAHVIMSLALKGKLPGVAALKETRQQRRRRTA